MSGDYPPRDSLEVKFCPHCGAPCAGIVRLAEDGRTFDASAAFFIEKTTAVMKGGVAFGREVKRLTLTHQRRAKALLRSFGLAMEWFHNGRATSENMDAPATSPAGDSRLQRAIMEHGHGNDT